MGRVCIPKIGWGNWGDTCEHEDDEGVQGKLTFQRCGKWGQSGIPDLGGFGGDWMPAHPCFGGAPVRRGVGGRPAIPHPLFHGKDGVGLLFL